MMQITVVSYENDNRLTKPPKTDAKKWRDENFRVLFLDTVFTKSRDTGKSKLFMSVSKPVVYSI